MPLPWRSALLTLTAAGLLLLAAGASSAAEEVAPGQALEPEELEALVAPVALYPDDLLAIVLPASTYPLQIVQAARYLEAVEDDPSLTPDEDWHESVVALLNYPEVVAKLNGDLDWTEDLGRAVLGQEGELLAAVDRFRRQAHSAGNLTSDRYKRVEVDGNAIEILPADPSVLYVPYYQPRLMRLPQPYSVYHYYPRPCPVYYYPYPAGHPLASRYFWGLTGAFSIGWHSRHLQFHLLQHRGHPYYGHSYAYQHYRYLRPRLERRSFHGDDPERWRPEPRRPERPPPAQYRRPIAEPPPVDHKYRQVPGLNRYRDDADTPRLSRQRQQGAASPALPRSPVRAHARSRAGALARPEIPVPATQARSAQRIPAAHPRTQRQMAYPAAKPEVGRPASPPARPLPAPGARAAPSSRPAPRGEAPPRRGDARRKALRPPGGSYEPR